MNDYPHNNFTNMKLNNLYGNARMNWMIHQGTLEFTPSHMNSVLVETWEAFNLSLKKPTQNAFKTPPHPTLSPHQTLPPTTKLVLLVLNSKTEINLMILDLKKRPVLGL